MWQQVLSTNLALPFRDFITDYEFSSPLISIDAFATADYNDNFRIGKVRAIYSSSAVVNAKSSFRTIRLQKQFIQFLDLPYSYKLEFVWYVWLPALTLTFYEPQFGDVIDLATIQGLLIEGRANTAYLQRQLTQIEQALENIRVAIN